MSSTLRPSSRHWKTGSCFDATKVDPYIRAGGHSFKDAETVDIAAFTISRPTSKRGPAGNYIEE